MALMDARWQHLVAETQFANELIVSGLRKLCSVPVGLWGDDRRLDNDRSYPLYVGLYSFTSGLERLCKLTIACHGFALNGRFPDVRKFNHKLDELLDSVEGLDFTSTIFQPAPVRPSEELDPDLTTFLRKFASGGGRYEHLDSLSSTEPTVSVVDSWVSFSLQSLLANEVKSALDLRSAVFDALRTVSSDSGLEEATYEILEQSFEPYFEPSVGVVLRLYTKANWVASALNIATSHTHADLPELGEIIRSLLSPVDDFFPYVIAQIGDVEIAAEGLATHLRGYSVRDHNDEDSISSIAWIGGSGSAFGVEDVPLTGSGRAANSMNDDDF